MCLDPTHQRANGNLKYFEYQLAKQKKVEHKEEGQAEGRQRRETRGQVDDYLPERKTYEKLCRGVGIRMVRSDPTQTHVLLICSTF